MIIICCDTYSIKMSGVLLVSPNERFSSIKHLFNFTTISCIIFKYKPNLFNKSLIDFPIGVYFSKPKVISSL